MIPRARGLVVLLLALVAGCTPAPPAHPLGGACTWPAEVDPQRDGLAVLTDNGAGSGYRESLVLLDVATGTVRARCTGIASGLVAPGMSLADGFSDETASSPASVLLPPVSADYRFAVTADGVVELATGALTPNPDPQWRAVGFPGGGTVLRQRPGDPRTVSTAQQPENWCVAPAADAPQDRCTPVAGAGPGGPAPHGDGTVGWAPLRPVPASFTRAGAPAIAGTVQTDGVRVLQARVDPSTDARLAGAGSIVDASGRAGTLSPDAFRFQTRYRDLAEHPVWYTVDRAGPAGVTATLHTARATWDTVRGGSDLVGRVDGAAVVDGGGAVVLATGGGSPIEVRFVRVGEQGAPRVVARTPLGGATGLSGVPRIVTWPDMAAPSVG